MKYPHFLSKKTLAYLSLGLPIFLLIILLRLPKLERGQIQKVGCILPEKSVEIFPPVKPLFSPTPTPTPTPNQNQVKNASQQNTQPLKPSPQNQKPPTPRIALVPISNSPLVKSQENKYCVDEQLWGEKQQKGDRQGLITAIDRSLQYLQTDKAEAAYKRYQVPGITRDRVTRSLQRFRQLVLQSKSPADLAAAVNREFIFYQAIGSDGKGTVLFTAYFEPLYNASRTPSAEFRYPVFRRPPDFDSWKRPHPTRLELEGADGLQWDKGKLRGLELFWFRDRLEPFMAQIQGSARLKLTDGTQTSINYDGSTRQDYISIGRELANDGKLALEGLRMQTIEQYFHKNPQDLNVYLPRNPSFVFFRESHGNPARGSIGVPLIAERSIATDKSLMPPGALALIRSSFPFYIGGGKKEIRRVTRYVLDQDTGGAIKGAGRVDYFLGTGYIAGERSGLTVSNGQLYYLLLRK